MNPLEKPFRIVENKIYSIIDKILMNYIKPSIKLNQVSDINIQLIKKLKSQYGIGGLILDIDDTLRKDIKPIPKCNQEWLKYMKQEFKVIIVSNGFDKDIKSFASENEIEYMGFCKKPFKKYFLDAANKMGLDPENVLVIGDDIICDIYGGNRCGMITAIVKDVVNRDDFER